MRLPADVDVPRRSSLAATSGRHFRPTYSSGKKYMILDDLFICIQINLQYSQLVRRARV